MSAAARRALGWFASAASLLGQSSWQVEGGRLSAQVQGAAAARIDGAAREIDGSGRYEVHFGADAAGKPMSLALDVPAGSRVVVGAARGLAAARGRVDLSGDGAFAGTLGPTWGAEPVQVRAAAPGGDAGRDVRLTARVERVEGARWFALVGRFSEAGGCYLFVVDWEQREVRLERQLGFDRVVLRRARAPQLGDRASIAFQLEGFRLQGCVDDAVVVRSFDGAVSGGAPGVAWCGAAPRRQELRAAAPAPPRASVAVVQRPESASARAAVPQQPGSLALLELSLDRPHGWIPRGTGGFEPFLRQPLAAPVVLRGDVRGALGVGALGEVDAAGELQAELEWPALPALRLRAALLRWRIADAKGEGVVAVTPAVRLRF